MTTSIYLAARFSRKREMQGYARDLASIGCHVTSRWIVEGAHQWAGTPDEEIPEYALTRFAQEDLDDIDAADVLVIFTDSPSTKGGMWTELGFALGKGKTIIAVGPPANLFVGMLPMRVGTWDEAVSLLDALTQEAA